MTSSEKIYQTIMYSETKPEIIYVSKYMGWALIDEAIFKNNFIIPFDIIDGKKHIATIENVKIIVDEKLEQFQLKL
jgi:hypothetical protein